VNDYFEAGRLNIVHFTHGSTDPLQGCRSHGVRVVMLADGAGADETYVSCIHIEPGGWVTDPPSGRDSVVLVVHGDVTLVETHPVTSRNAYPGTVHHNGMSPGVGVVLSADTRYRMESEAGAILIVVEAERLQATESGKSTPERVLGQTWPGEDLDKPKPRTLISISKRLWFLWRFRKLRRAVRLDRSGWEPAAVEVGPVRKFLFGLGWGRKMGR